MRIVEPRRVNHSTVSKPKIKPGRVRFVLPIMLLVVAFGIYKTFISNKTSGDPIDKSAQQTAPSEQAPDELVEDTEEPSAFRQFTGQEFRLFYDNLLQPNLDKVDVPPIISGNDIADARIRSIAEKRGYKLRSSPTVTLPSVDDYQLQQAVHQPWLDLKQSALNSGLTMTVVSGYRSIENQRALFLNRLQAEQVDINDVAAGSADAEINNVLITSAIPGYSKHHTGYTIDLVCAGFEFENFKNSPCNEWLSKNNYENAKNNGFLPSYPPDVALQGPDPEAWEYVWVGSELLYR